MKPLRLGILGSGKGSNCRAILESIRSGALPAEARVVISDVLDAPILEIAREFSVPNAYLPPGQFRTRLEPNVDVGYIRVDPAEPIMSNVLGTVIGPSGFVERSETYRPRSINLFPATIKDPARYEFTKRMELSREDHVRLKTDQLDGEAWKDLVVFLGVTALESVGISVDLADRTLRRLPAVPLK